MKILFVYFLCQWAVFELVQSAPSVFLHGESINIEDVPTNDERKKQFEKRHKEIYEPEEDFVPNKKKKEADSPGREMNVEEEDDDNAFDDQDPRRCPRRQDRLSQANRQMFGRPFCTQRVDDLFLDYTDIHASIAAVNEKKFSSKNSKPSMKDSDAGEIDTSLEHSFDRLMSCCAVLDFCYKICGVPQQQCDVEYQRCINNACPKGKWVDAPVLPSDVNSDFTSNIDATDESRENLPPGTITILNTTAEEDEKEAVRIKIAAEAQEKMNYKPKRTMCTVEVERELWTANSSSLFSQSQEGFCECSLTTYIEELILTPARALVKKMPASQKTIYFLFDGTWMSREAISALLKSRVKKYIARGEEWRLLFEMIQKNPAAIPDDEEAKQVATIRRDWRDEQMAIEKTREHQRTEKYMKRRQVQSSGPRRPTRNSTAEL